METFQDWSNLMVKRSILLLVLVCLFSHFFLFKPTFLQANEPIFLEKLLFFKETIPFSWNHAQIDFLKQQKEIKELERFPKLNAMRIVATNRCIQSIQATNPTATIMDDFICHSHPVKKGIEEDNNNTNPNWNLDLIHVKELWEKGFTGKGVKIGILDTGADGNHPALLGKIKNFAYFDKNGTAYLEKNTYDTDNHGTHVSGIAAGGSTSEPLGVAPDANLSVGVVIPGGSGSFSQIIGGLEWQLDPDGDASTNDSPRAINLSLGLPGYFKVWTPIFQKLLSHNILPVCSIGNEGDGISSSPGNCPNAFSVGAFDNHKEVGYFSSGSDRIQWEDSTIATDTYLKPDISAPGVRVRSSVPNKEYDVMSGTSMASPHVAGATAILAEAYPTASAYDLSYFLKLGSQDEGKKGTDTRYGSGSLNVFQSWKLLNDSVRLSGKLNNFIEGYSLRIVETNLPVYINQNHLYSTHLLPGTYHLEITYKEKVTQQIKVDLVKQDIMLDISLPAKILKKIEGKVKNTNGQPLLATIITNENKALSTKIDGTFSLTAKSGEEITIKASGYQEQKLTISEKEMPFQNITLKKVKVLLVEGTSNYLAIKNPPRFAKNYFFQALLANQIPFAYQDASLEPLRWEDVESFETIIFFFEGGTFKPEEGKVLTRFLQNGGKIIITGRMIKLLEDYMELSFLGDHFGVASRETISFPSISSMTDDLGFDNLQFALTGNGGANNQESCDVLQKKESSINPIPFLKFNEVGKERYAGVLASNGIYRGIYLPFGFEGIGSAQARIDLMRKMMTWLYNTGSIDIKMPDKVPFFIELKRNSGQYLSTIVESGIFHQGNLEPGQYQIRVHGFGYENFETAQYIGSGDQLSLLVQPKKSPLYQAKINLNQFQGTTSFLEVIFHHQSVYFKEFPDASSYSIDLPPGEYVFIVRSPLYETKYYQASLTETDVDIRIDMRQSIKKILLVDDSETGDYLLDRYARIGDYYAKHLASTPNNFDTWSVSQKGKPEYLDLLPYQLVLYVSGLSMVSMVSPIEKEQISLYLNRGGKILLTGNYVHTMLQGSTFLREYFGIDVKSSNVREQAVRGAQGSPFTDMSFDLADNFSNNGIYVPFGSFDLVHESAQPILVYYGGEIASTFYQGSTFKSIFLPFGIDNITRSTVRIDLINRMIKLLLAN